MFPRSITVLAALCLVAGGCRTLRPRPIYEIPMTDTSRQSRLLRGFQEIKDRARFTGRVFAVSLDTLPTERATYLELDCYVPPDLPEDFRTMTLIAKVNGVEVGRQTFYESGHATFTRYVPVQALKRTPAEVEFELDRSFTEAETGRVIGVSVHSIGFKEYEQTLEYRDTQTWMAHQGFRKAIAERKAQIPPAKEQEMMRLFDRLPGWKDLRFQNIKTAQNPLDLWMIQQILFETQPEFVIATGTGQGGAALFYAHALNGMGLANSRVLTIDSQDLTKEAATRPLWKRYVEFTKGAPADPAVLQQIAARIKGGRTMVILDSPDRSVSRVLDELRAYAALVSRGGYLVASSTYLDGVPVRPGIGPGPFEAVRRFLQEGGDQQFEQDFSREVMILTFNPGGWLRRK